jgi:hypothetical protein
MDPVYFLEDSISVFLRLSPLLSELCALTSAPSALRTFFHPRQKQKALRFPGALSNFIFLLSKTLQTFWIAGISPLVFSNICSFLYTSELMSYVASSNPCPCVIASVGQASTQ